MNYYKIKDKDAVAKSFNCPISFKFSVEMAREIKSMPYEKAIRFLDDVIALKRPLQLKRYNRDVAHRKGKIGEVKSGRFPVKVAKYFKKVLEIAKANADYKGLDSSKKDLIIKGAVVSQGIKRYSYQTQGKRRLRRDQSTNIEIVLTQQGKFVKKDTKAEKKEIKETKTEKSETKELKGKDTKVESKGEKKESKVESKIENKEKKDVKDTKENIVKNVKEKKEVNEKKETKEKKELKGKK